MNISQGSAVVVRERLRFEPKNGLACWRDLLRELPEQGACWDSSHFFLLKPEARFLTLLSSVDDGVGRVQPPCEHAGRKQTLLKPLRIAQNR